MADEQLEERAEERNQIDPRAIVMNFVAAGAVCGGIALALGKTYGVDAIAGIGAGIVIGDALVYGAYRICDV